MSTVALILALVLMQFDPFSVSVARRCAGEAGWPDGVHLCACTVKSRLEHGWDKSDVLKAYYAPDLDASDALVQAADSGLAGKGCPTDAYYLFEQYSVDKLGLNLSCMSSETRQGSKVVRSFQYRTLKESGCFGENHVK